MSRVVRGSCVCFVRSMLCSKDYLGSVIGGALVADMAGKVSEKWSGVSGVS